MSLLAEYHLSFEHLPLVGVAAAVPDTTLRLEVGQPNQAGPPPFVVRASGDSFEAVERAFEEAVFVRNYVSIYRNKGAAAYRIEPAATMEEQLGDAVDDPDGLRSLASIESTVESITVTPAGWRQERWFADRDAFGEYCAFWRANASSFTLQRLTRTDIEPDAGNGMTASQREAIRTATDMGYFEVPRDASLREVAAALDISAPSLSERLRRAQQHLVNEVGEPPAPKKA